MYIKVYFAENGSPKTGLSPTVTVYKDSDNSVIVNAQAMTEIGGGFYKYDFSTYDSEESYCYIVDSVTLTGQERYAPGAIEKNHNGLEDILENSTSVKKYLRGLIAPFLAKRTGMGTSTTVFRDQADGKDRVTVALDGSGNITAIVMDLT